MALAHPSQSASGSQSLGRRALHGLVFSLAQNGVARLLSLSSQIVLAILLQPSDFGLIALANTITAITTNIIGFGVEDVILQRQATMRFWMGTGFGISLTLATLAAVVVLAIAPFAMIAFHAPQLLGLLAILAVTLPITALSSVPSIILRANMRFGFLAGYGSIELGVQTALIMLFAWFRFGAFSFVIPPLMTGILRVSVYWWAAGDGVQLNFRLSRWRHLIGRSTSTALSRILTGFIGQGDYFVLSILASKVVLGQYYFAFRLAAQPVWVLAANFSTVMLPALARMSDDPKRQGQAAVRAARLLSFAVLPVGMLEAIAARPLLLGLFNTKWAAAIPMVQLLSIGISLDAVSWLAGSFMAARGRFHDLLRYMLPQVPLFFVLVDLGAVSHGAVGVAAAVAVFYAVSQPVYVYFAFREIGVTKSQVAGIYLRPILYCVISGAVALAVASLSVFNGYDLLQVAVLGTVGSLVYAALVRVREPQVWGELESRLKGALPGRRRG